MSLGRTAVLLSAVFCLTLAIVVVQRLSSEAVAVAAGVVCGVAAGLPAVVLLYAAILRRLRQAEDERRRDRNADQPPLVIVQSQAAPPLLQDAWPVLPEEEGTLRGQVRLVGGEDLLAGDGQDNRG